MKEIEILIKLHQQLYQNDIGGITRPEASLVELNNMLLLHGNTNSNDLTLIVKNLIYCCAIILCLQPFYDGNTHAAKAYMIYKLKEKGYDLDNNEIENDHFIPIIYDINENEISNQKINTIIRKIKSK